MDKETIFIFLMISTVVIGWILSAICLTKILGEKNYGGWQILFAWIPFLSLIPVGKIIGMGFWRLFGVLFLIGFILGLVNQFLIFSIENEAVYLILTSIIYAWPGFYLWSKIARNGQHPNYNLLGLLAGLPIISVFTIPYITWGGNWRYS